MCLKPISPQPETQTSGLRAPDPSLIAATYMDNCQDFPHSFVKGADVRTKPELYAEGSEMLFFPSKKAFFFS